MPKASTARLKLLDGPSPARPRARVEPLSREELEDWADNLPIKYLECRGRRSGHNLVNRDIWPIGRRGDVGILWRCSCGLEITEYENAAGFVTGAKTDYPPGYLAPKGAGRASKERNAMLRQRRNRRLLDARKKIKK